MRAEADARVCEAQRSHLDPCHHREKIPANNETCGSAKGVYWHLLEIHLWL